MPEKKRGQRSKVKGADSSNAELNIPLPIDPIQRKVAIENRLQNLADSGRGKVSPNPLVGVLIEKNAVTLRCFIYIIMNSASEISPRRN